MILPLAEGGMIGFEFRQSRIEDFQGARLLIWRGAFGIRFEQQGGYGEESRKVAGKKHTRIRRGWDSNPRELSLCRFSRPEPSTTRPPLLTDERSYSDIGRGGATAEDGRASRSTIPGSALVSSAGFHVFVETRTFEWPQLRLTESRGAMKLYCECGPGERRLPACRAPAACRKQSWHARSRQKAVATRSPAGLPDTYRLAACAPRTEWEALRKWVGRDLSGRIAAVKSSRRRDDFAGRSRRVRYPRKKAAGQ